MSKRPEHINDMSLHEKPKTDRLYPSLPDINWYDVCIADPSTVEKRHTAAGYHDDRLLADRQSEAASSDAQMKVQLVIMEEQMQELLSINEKWAKEYRTMVKYYKQKVQDLKASLNHDHFEETSEGGEKKIQDKENTWAGDKLLKAEKEAKELSAKNGTLVLKVQHQCEEIRRLNKALEEALQTSTETPQDVWKHQAEVYKEDFLKERRDRNKLKEKYLEQERKFRTVHSELRALKSQMTRPHECVACPHWEVRQINQNHIQLQRRHTP